VAGEVAALDAEWLRGKGKHAKPLEFLVGEHGGPMQPHRRLFTGRLEGRLAGYVSYSPVPGTRPGWLHDLSRRSSTAPPGVMEVLVAECLRSCAEEQTPWFHFGFTPFTSLDPADEVAAASPAVAGLLRLLARHGEHLYPAASQLDYKQKWGQLTVLPNYLAFDGRPSLAGITRLMQVANMI